MKAITTLLVAIVIGSFAAIALTPTPADAPPEEVAKISPKNLCDIIYVNYPRRHWCDRQGHVHWR